MVTVVGIRFKKAGKIYYFDPGDIQIEKDSEVIVETARGLEFGIVVIAPRDINDDEVISPLKSVIRLANDTDKAKNKDNLIKEKEAFQICLRKIGEHKLPMKLIDVEYTFDNSKIIFYFVADGRIDFRELVKDLASVFRTRIELRQIGVRDEAKMMGGMGPCGRPMCCASFLGDFEPVSIKMAKEQNLSLNPTKISGVCGRLMCCLNYEQETYEKIRKNTPAVGSVVRTEDGDGEVVENNIIKESVKVKIRVINEDKEKGKEDNFEVRNYPINDVKLISGGYEYKDISEEEIKKELQNTDGEAAAKILQDDGNSKS